MNPDRPPVAQLALVDDDKLVFRFVQPKDFNGHALAGARVQLSALQTNECTPNDQSYGASVYVKSLLSGGLADLHAACAKWSAWRVSEVPVAKISALGVTVRLSPQDCPFVEVRHAHASLIGVTRPLRNQLIRIIEEHLVA